MNNGLTSIAILGGTGALGTGLAKRWAKAGYKIIIGSRTEAKANQAVLGLMQGIGEQTYVDITPADNKTAAEQANIVVLTVPYAHHADSLRAVRDKIQGKILIDVTVPLMPPKVGTVQLPSAGSAAQEAQSLLGENVRVVSAFQNVAATHLQADKPIDCDILVAGNNKDARETVLGLVKAAGMRGFSVGPIANSAAAEALTSILIQINRQHKCHAGIRISGLPEDMA